MATEQRFISELCETTNNITGKVTYYIQICGVFRRVSKSDYDKRYEEADGLSCLHTVKTKKFNKSYRTVSYYLTID